MYNISLKGRWSPLLMGLMTSFLIATSVCILDCADLQKHLEQTRALTLNELSTVRAKTESSINKRLYLTLGLKAFVSCNPDLSSDEFYQFAAALQKEGSGIRSVTLIKDNIINDVYPFVGNEGAIGLKLLDHPQQRKAALNAIKTGKPWLSGPVKLVQGGKAFINRAPVYVATDDGKPASERYWGMVSLLIEEKLLLDEITIDCSSDFKLAIRNSDNMSEGKGYFFGDESIETMNPLSLKVNLPTGYWYVYAVPVEGWPTSSPRSVSIRIFGGTATLLAGFLVYFLTAANIRYKKARIVADDSSRAKSEFLSNMSHELRTPMTSILGFSELLVSETNETEKSKKHLDFVKTIQKNGNYLLEIINDILDLSKIEAGKINIERIQCSPAEILSDVISLMEVRTLEKDLMLNVKFESAVPETIKSDPTRIRQILINIIGNAIKFTKRGEITVVLRLINHASKSPLLQYDVIDTGIGMTMKQMENLFQPFAQADTTTTRKFGGTGLGLTISKRFAEMLGGNISFKSTAGKGTTFTITLATGSLDNVSLLHQFRNTELNSSPEKTPSEEKNDLACRILLAEDGPDNQRLISLLLKKAGAEVTLATNGKLAVDFALTACDEGKPFDVILIDMQMPVMDGYTAVNKLREANYSGPIIALTANALSTDRDKCLEAGCDDYTTKPIDRKKLISLIYEYSTVKAQ